MLMISIDQKTMSTYVDRLVRRSILSLHLEEGHPLLEESDELLFQSELEIRSWAGNAMRLPGWESVKKWFCSRVPMMAESILPYYGYSPSVSERVLADVKASNFERLLCGTPSRSGTMSSPGSNVMLPDKWKTS